jgi:hypothetical protein
VATPQSVATGQQRQYLKVDYTYGLITKALAFLNEIPVTAADRMRIVNGNVERLFAF